MWREYLGQCWCLSREAEAAATQTNHRISNITVSQSVLNQPITLCIQSNLRVKDHPIINCIKSHWSNVIQDPDFM